MATARQLIVSGFKEDCERLISRFEQANDIRFETFCEIWKDMKFSLIFTGRQNMLELLEFCEEALHISKQYLLLPPRFKERIGGLYLLYGIYYKMPVDQFKIRVKVEDWRSIMELHAEIKEAEHLDANYILCKLITDNAFHYCIFDREFGLEKYFRVKERQGFNPYSVLPAMKDLTEGHQVLSKITELSKRYNEQKLATISKVKSEASLNLYNSHVAEEIANDICKFEDERRSRQITEVVNPKGITVASTSKEAPKKQRSTRRKTKSGLDDFDSESQDSDDEMALEIEEYDPNLPQSFD